MEGYKERYIEVYIAEYIEGYAERYVGGVRERLKGAAVAQANNRRLCVRFRMPNMANPTESRWRTLLFYGAAFKTPRHPLSPTMLYSFFYVL